jgi:hypothetical protein
VVGLADVDETQVYTLLVTVGLGGLGFGGGFLSLQPEIEHFEPGHDDEQYEVTDWHQSLNAQQSRFAGNPACRKQDRSWILHCPTALRHEVASEKLGRGVEHQFPHLYSQVGVGLTV